MSSPDTEQIEKMVADLDAAVPREGAVVQLSQYGGVPLESQIIANRDGYLRLGIELMRAAFAPPMPRTKAEIDLDLRYMMTYDSNVNFDRFYRREDLTIGEPGRRPLIQLVPALLTLALCSGIALVLIGLRTVISWIHR